MFSLVLRGIVEMDSHVFSFVVGGFVVMDGVAILGLRV